MQIQGDSYRPDITKRLNRVDNRYKDEKIYTQLGIKYENIGTEDITIDPNKKKIIIHNLITISSFLRYLHVVWYADDKLCRHRFPFRNNLTKVEKKHNWSVSGLKNIITVEKTNEMLKENKKG